MKALMVSMLAMASLAAHAQRTDAVKKLLELGKDSVVRLAIARLGEAGFADIAPDQFDWLKVQTDGHDVRVIFDRSIQYFPMNTFVVHTATVELVSTAVGWMPYGEPKDPFAPIHLYEYTAADRAVIAMVLSVQDWQQDKIALMITEEADSYLITESTGSGEAVYRWHKTTGSLSEEGHADYAPEEFDDGFREVDWENIKTSNK
ncbi:MAG: hypothetical protein RIE86_15200 [Imperialibacter sp.]|uniref:hypothetical protein n=1 Tax=Imperialibacter sp. TaxID=2038411 RepID=UPI0032ED930F